MQPVSDFQLLAETSPEHRAPFGEFYRRHAAAVYDFAWRVLKNASAAREALRETFREAFDSAGMVVRPADVRNWLYGIAYRAVMTRWEAGVEPSEEPPPSPPALVPGDAEVNADPETAALVWEAASGLDPRHYALLDLDLRRDFDGGEIAVITGQNRAQTVSLVARLERVVEAAILSYVVARRGAASCDQLRIILGDARIPPFPPDLRALVDRHIEACDTCYGLRQRVPSPLEVLAALEPVAPPEPVLAAVLAEALGEAPLEGQEQEPEAAETAEAEIAPSPTEETGAPSETTSVEESQAAREEPAPAEEAVEEAFPSEGVEEEPEALVMRGTAVSREQAALAPAAEREEAAFAPSPAAEPLPEAAWPVPGSAGVSPEAEAEAVPEQEEPEPAVAAGAAPPRRAAPGWREWLQRPWVSFGAGVAGGLLIIATVVAFMFASGSGGGASETPTPSPTATPEPTEAPVIIPTATDTPEPTPTDTPEPEPTEPPTATPTEPPAEPTATPSPTQPPSTPAPGTPVATGTPATGTPVATPTP